jgi:4-hydroxy-tetrahydrodipicolinate synthase
MITGRHVSKLSGYAPELPTPFNDHGNVDDTALELLCDRQIQEGATALVVCGTTGEAPTLRRAEHDAIVRIAVNVADGRVPVIASAGSNSTGQAIELAKDAEAAGADAVLSVVPYYNKPVQAGIYAHFRAIADSVGLPIILYDVPCAWFAVLRMRRSRDLPNFRNSSVSRTRPATSLGRSACDHYWGQIFGCCQAMTRPHWRSLG